MTFAERAAKRARAIYEAAEGPLRSSAAQSSRADVSLAVRQADAAAVIPSNPHRKVIIPLLYSLATLPIAAL